MVNFSDIEYKLSNLGFVIDRPLELGRNNVGTQYKPHSKNGVVTITEKFVNYMSFDGSTETGWFFTDDNNTPLMKKKIEREIIKNEEQERQNKLLKINAIVTKTTYKSAVGHPYLVRKKCHVDSKLKMIDDKLVVPLYHLHSKQIQALQYINSDGKKWYEADSIIYGNAFPILYPGKKLSDVEYIFLTEGYADGSSVFQALRNKNIGVLVCNGCNNIDVVKLMIQMTTKVPIIAIKDNDKAGRGITTQGFTVGNEGEDANDVYIKQGADVLKSQIINGLKTLGVSYND